jgi:predicted metal-dependent peptidase
VKVQGSKMPTMGTDGVNIFCGIHFVGGEDSLIVMFGLLHELIHIYFNHHARREKRNARTWNIACDLFTNAMCSVLLGDRVAWPVPERFIQPKPEFEGKTVEEIYEIINKQELIQAGSTAKYLPEGKDVEDEISNGGDMLPPPPMGVGDPIAAPQESTEWQSTFREDIARAKILAEKSPLHRPLSDVVQSRMDKILKPTLPWGSLLRGEISNELGWDEISYAPPKMKYYPLILPQTKQVKERVLVILVDVSASCTDALIRTFITNVQAAAFRATRIVIVTFDQIVREHYITKKPRDIFTKVKFNSGAHSFTSAIDAFEIARKEKPSACVCFTDGYIDLPDFILPHTTFVIPTGGQVQPWGKNYIMEQPWH